MVFCRAYELGLIGRADMIPGPHDARQFLRLYPTKKNHARQFDYFSRFSFLKDLFTETRDRLLDIELKRGDSPTPATPIIAALGKLEGMTRLIRNTCRPRNDDPAKRILLLGRQGRT